MIKSHMPLSYIPFDVSIKVVDLITFFPRPSTPLLTSFSLLKQEGDGRGEEVGLVIYDIIHSKNLGYTEKKKCRHALTEGRLLLFINEIDSFGCRASLLRKTSKEGVLRRFFIFLEESIHLGMDRFLSQRNSVQGKRFITKEKRISHHLKNTYLIFLE